MDFNDTPEEAAFRDEARRWLEANVPAADELKGLDEIERSKLWQKRKCHRHSRRALFKSDCAT